MRPPGVTLVITTLTVIERSKSEVDQAYDMSMRAARELAAAGVDLVFLGGVPVNLSRGDQNAQIDAADARGGTGRQGLVERRGAGESRKGARLQEEWSLPIPMARARTRA